LSKIVEDIVVPFGANGIKFLCEFKTVPDIQSVAVVIYPVQVIGDGVVGTDLFYSAFVFCIVIEIIVTDTSTVINVPVFRQRIIETETAKIGGGRIFRKCLLT